MSYLEMTEEEFRRMEEFLKNYTQEQILNGQELPHNQNMWMDYKISFYKKKQQF